MKLHQLYLALSRSVFYTLEVEVLKVSKCEGLWFLAPVQGMLDSGLNDKNRVHTRKRER
jgi:hypothetical protein